MQFVASFTNAKDSEIKDAAILAWVPVGAPMRSNG